MKPQTNSPRTPTEVVSSIADQAENLSPNHGDLVDLVAEINIHSEWFTDSFQQERRSYALDSLVSVFLYQYAQGMSAHELVDHIIKNSLTSQLDLPRAPSQALLSQVWRNQFTQTERSVIRTAALHVKLAHDLN
ncbi:hypothetical protein ACFQL4_13025 [Halosimplex aquaticum]